MQAVTQLKKQRAAARQEPPPAEREDDSLFFQIRAAQNFAMTSPPNVPAAEC